MASSVIATLHQRVDDAMAIRRASTDQVERQVQLLKIEAALAELVIWQRPEAGCKSREMCGPESACENASSMGNDADLSGNPPVTRAEHLEWAKQRALAYLPYDPRNAMKSMVSDLGKHKELANHVGLLLMPIFYGTPARPDEVRRWIEGFA